MRKKIVTGMLAVLLVFMMTGCCLSHDWQEATCTEPKTCSKCGKTEGEALRHTWKDATCAEPKTCSVCQETEGEALGHTLSEATYWEAAVCSVCGETVGDVLTPAFEELGVKGQFMEVGKTYDYNTQTGYEDMLINELKEYFGIEGDYANLTDFFMEGMYGNEDFLVIDEEEVEVTEENLIRLYSEIFGLTGDFENLTEVFMAGDESQGLDWGDRTTARATVTDYQVFDSDDTHEAKDGYEWKTVEMQIEFWDENSSFYGWSVAYGHDDYYEKDAEDGESDQGDSGYEPYWDNEAIHTVSWKGQDYTECRAIIADVSDTGWVEDAEGNFTLTYTAKFDFLYPKGYDGVLLYLYDAKNIGVRPVNFANTDENTLFFRLQ